MNRPRLFAGLLALALTGAASAAPVAGEHVEAELIAENLSFRPGDAPNWVALRLVPETDWHIYWRNPGDSGIPTKLQWALPAGVTAGDIQWPYPHRHSLGDLTNYGYGEPTLHLVPVTVASAAGGDLDLRATAKWLVCKDICIPGEAQVSLRVPLMGAEPKPDPKWVSAFAETRAALPRAVPDWSSVFALADGDVSVDIQGAKFAPGSEVEFFPYANDLVTHAAPQRIALDERNGLRLSQKLSPYFVSAPEKLEGVLVVHEKGGAKAFEIVASAGAVEPVPAPTQAEVGPAPPAAAPAARGDDPTLIGMLAAALLGGLILNLMPCVFPVLAMKALSVLNARGETHRDNRRHALAYTAGVVGSFVVVAGILLALRAAGAALGWGFQLQSPPFVYALILVIVAIGLSLAGLVQFGASWMGAGQSLATKPGLAGSFFTGVLAVVVASPCTAPFMAGALGFALTQPPPIAVLVFVALGIGMALPFLLIGFFPRVAGVLPRPGAWMPTLKEFLAFPMFLTAAWLLYVLGGLTDRDAMAYALVGVVLVSFALWLAGRGHWSIAGRLFAAAAIAGAVWIGFHPALDARPPQAATAPVKAGWEPYSDARMAELRAQGRSVFVDFTADWCLTCKVNERTVLRTERVESLFRARDVALLVGDWTRSDPAITAVLARYGRSGVPLYLASNAGAEPVVLPQVLTPSIIEDAFR
ncbi:MAG TPA: protein-disulfide reductase DsbD domain-containing protein, partial [Nevskiaceae bacterium]|nr:protein-disulfide reductase DsbD domain-containing protein [Nevskiaceae bacterium]